MGTGVKIYLRNLLEIFLIRKVKTSLNISVHARAQQKSVLKRREELLPTQTFTESDSYTSNICISAVAIGILFASFALIFVLDFPAIGKQIIGFAWPRIHHFATRCYNRFFRRNHGHPME